MVLLQALPASLRVLLAFSAPVDVLAQLTALESLTLEDTISDAGEAASSLSALQQLTRLHLGRAEDAEMDTIRACTGLRSLCLGGASLLPAQSSIGNICDACGSMLTCWLRVMRIKLMACDICTQCHALQNCAWTRDLYRCGIPSSPDCSCSRAGICELTF